MDYEVKFTPNNYTVIALYDYTVSSKFLQLTFAIFGEIINTGKF